MTLTYKYLWMKRLFLMYVVVSGVAFRGLIYGRPPRVCQTVNEYCNELVWVKEAGTFRLSPPKTRRQLYGESCRGINASAR